MFNFISSNRGSLSWGIVALFYFYDYLLKFSVSVLKPTLMSQFDISNTDFGIIMSMYMIAYTIMQIPAGVLADYWGPRKTITLAAVACGLGCILFSEAGSETGLLVGRAFIGFGASFALVTCLKLAANWFKPTKFAFLFGSMVSLAFIGGIFGINLTTFLINLYGWERSMFLAGILCLILAVIMWGVIRDSNPANNLGLAKQKTPILQLCRQLLEILRNKQAWYAATYSGLMFVPTTVLAFWGTTYLSEANGLSIELAGGLTSTIFLGWIVGSPTYGFTSGMWGCPRLHMLFAAVMTLISGSALIFSTGLSYMTVAVLMFLVGFASSGFTVAFTVLKENLSLSLTGAAMGFMNTANTLFEFFSVIVIGKVIDLQFGDTVLENYQYAFMFVPASTILALLILPFFKLKSGQKH